jgi:alginate O-acetyltransferase complex protein AlgI
MLFNSYVFLFGFLPLVVAVWWLLAGHTRLRLAWLTLASYVFYSWFEFPRGLELLPLLLVSTGADYVAGARIHASDEAFVRRRWLWFALSINLGLLGVFKYLGFFQGVVNGVLALAGADVQVPVSELVLPIGISFYTFNSMSYTIDIYRGRAQPAPDVLHYSAFVSLFPHLIAGPIVRYTDIEAQLGNLHRRLTSGMFGVGMFFLVCGLSKKLLLADSIAPTVDRLFATDQALGLLSAWGAAIGFSLQMYFDFSGYSDMAVGLALMLGFRFPQNFNSPYKARDISEFWRRWHVTLSRWFRDYVFVPLGGSRDGGLLTARNLFITMFLAGLWHGAAWTFVVFGLLQGVMLGAHGLARARGWPRPPAWVGRAATYLSFVATLVVFRSPTLETAGNVLAAMVGANGLRLGDFSWTSELGSAVPLAFVGMVVSMLAWVNVAPNTFEYRPRPNVRTGIVLGGLLGACILVLSAPSPFLYFQF